jgi:hypothetical protein
VNQPGVLERRAHVGREGLVDPEGDAQEERSRRLGNLSIDRLGQLDLRPGHRACE